MSRYQVLPVEPIDGQWNVPDEAIVSLWRRVVAAGKVEQTFYSGGISSPDEFLAFIKSPQIAACIVIDTAIQQPHAFAWLTNIENSAAFAHYCVLARPSRAVGRAILEFWKSFRGPDGKPLLDLLLGITPKNHTAALRVLRILGFTSIGAIPRYCHCVSTGSRVDGVISYREFDRDVPS